MHTSSNSEHGLKCECDLNCIQCAFVNMPREKHCHLSPDALRHVDAPSSVPVNVSHEGKVRLKALHGEEAVDERVEQTLVKVVVDTATVDALGEKRSHGTPRDLVWGEVGAPLQLNHIITTWLGEKELYIEGRKKTHRISLIRTSFKA